MSNINDFVIYNGVLENYLGTDTKVVVPYGVTVIGDRAFSDCRLITDITLPQGLTSIGNEAFRNCRSLKSLVIPEGVTGIGNDAFFCCASLTDLIIPEGVKSIGDYAFFGCDLLTSLVLPKSVKKLGNDPFRCATGRQKIIYMNQELTTSFYSPESKVIFVLRSEQGLKFLAYSSKAYSSNFKDFIEKRKWSEYDAELINDGPCYKYNLSSRCAGALGRLVDPIDLSEDNRAFFVEFLIKNAKKLVPIAEEVKCPEIIGYMFDFGIINQTNEKAIRKLLSQSSAPEISVFANKPLVENIKATTETVTEISPLQQKYIDMLQSIKGDKIISDMKMKGVSIPEVLLKDGTTAPKELFLYLMVSYGAQYGKEYMVNDDADQAAMLVSYESLCEAIEKISDGFNGVAYPSLLPLICRYGNQNQIERLIKLDKSWSEWSKFGAKGRNASKTLSNALILSNTHAAIKFYAKNNRMNEYSQAHKIEVDVLYNDYLFNFGFDEDGVRIFDLGETKIQARLNSDMKLELTNLTNGKTIKSIPKKNIDKEVHQKAQEEYDEMRKNLKDAFKIKRDLLYLDYLDSIEKDANLWQNIYFSNYFQRAVARLLVWEQDGKTFVISPNGLISSKGREFTLNQSPIRIAHPMEMDKEDLKDWQKYFVDNKIKQPFVQIWEPCYKPEEILEDRYNDCNIRAVYLKNQDRRGIYLNIRYDFYSDSQVDFFAKGLKVNAKLNDDMINIVITSVGFDQWTRRSNMVIGYLDRITIYGRIIKDDVSVEKFLPSFTLEQISDFIKIANENNATNVMAMLLEYKNNNFADFDPMAEFTLD